MSQRIDITAVLTVHAEGVLAGPSLVSFDQTIAAAKQSGLEVEGLIVLDRPDAMTHLLFTGVDRRHRLVTTNLGDPGLARNAAVAESSGQFIAFLDGDDLWAPDWLTSAHEFCALEPSTTIAHSEANIIFGETRAMWWHVDSRDARFDIDYLRIGNYWDAMSFASCEIYRRFPFAANDLRHGFGHEDWHWNCVTLSAGIDHRPVPGTLHFKRRRRDSQMALCDAINAVPWMSSLASYNWNHSPQGHSRKEH
jgi:glycosyltransferase involved in cell wall biosynthesis